MKFLIPLLLGLVGLGAGLGAGVAMYVPPEKPAEETGKDASEPKKDEKKNKGEAGEYDSEADVDYIKLNNQFIVPLIEDGKVISLVVLSLSLELDPGNEEHVYTREPRVRDAFLRVLFDHANAGGFSGNFTRSSNMIVLRDSLLEISRKTLGDMVRNVLIIDMVRQDLQI